MEVKFVDYEIERKGFWDYGFRFWLTEQWINKKGKLDSRIILTTNNFREITEKIQELVSQGIKMDFEENESLKQHKSELKI